MTKNKAGGWIAGTAFACVLILAAAWFVLVSPTLATAAETRAAAEAQLDQNAIAKTKLAKLKEQFENIDQLKADLAALQLQIPSTQDLSTYKRQVDAVALAHAVTVVSFQTQAAAPIAAPVEAAPAAEPAAESTDSATTETAPVAPAAPAPSFYAVPVILDVIGTYENVLAFLQDLQNATPRLLLVEQVSGKGQIAADASNGKPAIAEGDLEVTVTGSVYVLPPTPVVEVPDPTATPAAPAPLPPSVGRNPLLPLP